MRNYWVTMKSGKNGCVSAKDVETTRNRVRKKFPKDTISSVTQLPYAASPQLFPHKGDAVMCYDPTRCKGHTSCPKSRSCSS